MLWMMIGVVLSAGARRWNVRTERLTLKVKRPRPFMPKDLNQTHRKLESGGTLLMTEEGFGTLRHALFADLDGGGQKEVIATDDSGLVLAFKNDGTEIRKTKTKSREKEKVRVAGA